MKAILTYHSVEESGSVLSVSRAAFRRHVEWLALAGPQVVTVEQLLGLPDSASAIAITFDDALVNFADEAWPVLRDHGLPVTLFVPVDHVGGTNSWSANDTRVPALPVMGWEVLARLVEQGVTVGSHTCTHPRLTTLPAAAILEELERSAERLREHVGVFPAGIAYPYGDCDRVVEAAAAVHYRYGCTTELAPVTAGARRYRLPRLDTYYLREPRQLERWGTPQFSLYVRARSGARRCRALVARVGGR